MITPVFPKPDLPLREVLARWEVIAVRWGLGPEEQTALLGGFAPGPVHLVGSYQAVRAEVRMRLLLELDPILHEVIGADRKVAGWLRRTNRHLGGRTPIEALSSSAEWARWLIRSLGTAA